MRTSVTFKDGLKVNFRPIQPSDENLLKELFYSHSERTILQRYLAPIRELSRAQLKQFLVLDNRDDFALVGLVPHENRERMICVGRYFRNPGRDDAEIAVTVHDDFQHHGIGIFLVQSLMKIARENGIKAFTAIVRSDNHAMMRAFHEAAGKLEIKLETDIYQVRFELGDDALAKNV